MKELKYKLEITGPDDSRTMLWERSTTTPFASISVGDQISTVGLGVDENVTHLVVKNVKHFFFEEESQITHKICIRASV